MNLIKNSIAIFFALGVTFFLLIFLFGVAKNDACDTQINKSVLIKENEITRWGTIPGVLGYAWTRTYDLYSLQNTPNEQDGNLYMQKSDPMNVKVDRVFDNAEWAPTVSVVDYYEKYSSDSVSESANDDNIRMFNFGALSVLHQMNNKPDFWLAWKALCQVNTIMFNSSIINRYYAWNAYQYVFNDPDLVYAGVLGGFDSTTAQAIYTDAFYGMDTVNKLYYWVNANQNGADSDDYKNIVDYFATLSITLDAAAMEAIVGSNSIIGYTSITVNDNILKYYNFKPTVDQNAVILYQWGQDSFLPNPAITIVPYTEPIYSLSELNSDVLVAPEFAYFVKYIQNNLDEPDLSTDEIEVILNAQLEDYRTLLNPQNMEYFYVQYHLQNYSDLMKRFGFSYPSQVDSMYNYLEYLKDNQLGFKMYGEGYNYQKNVLGQLIQRYVNQSYGIIEDVLPLDLTARNLAYYNKQNSLDCASYVSQAVTDADTVTAICDGQDMTDPSSVKLFMNGTWYNDDSELIALGFTADDLTTFYDTTTSTTSFGYEMLQQTTAISTKYGCGNAANCTATELATLQWRSSGVTENPINNDASYTPKTNTMADWGDYATPQLNKDAAQAPEYFTCSSGDALTAESTGYIMDKQTGLANEIFAVQFAEFISNNNHTDTWATDLGVADATVLYQNLRVCIQDFLLQGFDVMLTQKDLVEGYSSTIADKINGGDFFMGADYDISNTVTPVVNEINGAVHNNKFGLYTGSLGVDEVSTIRRVNDVSYVNRNYLMFNGTYYHNVTLSPYGSDNMTKFAGASNGMQFAPGTEDGTLRIFDNSLLQIKSYSFSDDDDLEATSNEYPTAQFSYTNDGSESASNVGIAFDLDYKLYNKGCNGCDQSIFANNLKVNNENYQISSDASKNMVEVQSNTGFMSKSTKQGSMFLNFAMDGSSTLALPSLDGITGAVPVFDIDEQILINAENFDSQYSFVAESDQKVHAVTIMFIIFAILFFVLGIVALVVYRFKGGDKNS